MSFILENNSENNMISAPYFLIYLVLWDNIFAFGFNTSFGREYSGGKSDKVQAIKESKEILLRTISQTRKYSGNRSPIVTAIKELEGLAFKSSYPIESLSGEWSLVFSTQLRYSNSLFTGV